MNGNKKNIGKRAKQKRRSGGTGKGSAREKTEQGIAGQAEPGCGRAGEDDWESGGEVRDASEEKMKNNIRDKNPRLTLIALWSIIYELFKYYYFFRRLLAVVDGFCI